MPWENAILEKIPITPQKAAADMIKKYPLNLKRFLGSNYAARVAISVFKAF
jgi:hypothetical protein